MPFFRSLFSQATVRGGRLFLRSIFYNLPHAIRNKFQFSLINPS